MQPGTSRTSRPSPLRSRGLNSPRIEDLGSGRLKIGDVSRRHRHTMHQRRRRDQRVAHRPRVRDMKVHTTPSHLGINRQDPILKSRQYMIIEPRTKNHTLRGVTPLSKEDPDLQLLDRDRRDEQFRGRHVRRLSGHALVCLASPGLTQFRDDVGVEQKVRKASTMHTLPTQKAAAQTRADSPYRRSTPLVSGGLGAARTSSHGGGARS